MKKTLLILAVLSNVLSCNHQYETIDELNDNNIPSRNHSQRYTQRLSEDEALKIASTLLDKQESTRSISKETYSCEYILSKNTTRSSYYTNDTLAYIFNKCKQSGFAVISANPNTHPVLAYSEEGYFNQNNPSVKDNFIVPLGSYIRPTYPLPIDSGIFVRSRITGHFIQRSIGQWDPYNKHINLIHPGFPVGCVTIATAQIILHSSDTLSNFHGRTIQLESIRNALKYHHNDQSIPQPNYRNHCGPIYTYNEAIDSLGIFLSLLSDDLNTRYITSDNHNISVAYSSDAYSYLLNKEYDIKSRYTFFNMEDVANYILQNCIIYIDGRDPEQSVGHAFLADGCKQDFDGNNKLLSTMLHIDWGWDGESNGYYLGDVFESTWGNYSPRYYFAVKCLDYYYLSSYCMDKQ